MPRTIGRPGNRRIAKANAAIARTTDKYDLHYIRNANICTLDMASDGLHLDLEEVNEIIADFQYIQKLMAEDKMKSMITGKKQNGGSSTRSW